MRSKKPTEKRPWKSIQIATVVTSEKKLNSRNSTKLTRFSPILRKKPTTTVTEPWIITGLEASEEDFSEVLTLGILVIYFRRFLVEEWADREDRDEQISVRISRCD